LWQMGSDGAAGIGCRHCRPKQVFEKIAVHCPLARVWCHNGDIHLDSPVNSVTEPSMPARYAIYFAPARDSELWRRAEAWLAQPDLQPFTVSARRYGFHATLKAPMTLSNGCDCAALQRALAEFAHDRPPLALPGLAPRLIDGFLALTAEPQPEALTKLAAEVVREFDDFRDQLTVEDRTRRLKAPLTDRQI